MTAVLICYYKSKTLTPTWIGFLVGASWFLGFSGTLLLPLDIAQANTGTYTKNDAAHENCILLWQLVYWSTFILAWLVLPCVYEAWYAGELTWRGRLIASVKANAKFYLLTGIMGGLFSVYYMVNHSLSVKALMAFLLIFGNTYGLLLVICFLGNGLVEVPRSLWRLRNRDKELERVIMRAVIVDEVVYDAQIEWADCCTAARIMAQQPRED